MPDFESINHSAISCLFASIYLFFTLFLIFTRFSLCTGQLPLMGQPLVWSRACQYASPLIVTM